MDFNNNAPYQEDLKLLSQLGLSAWKAVTHQEILIGEVYPYADEEVEGEKTKIQIFVNCAPAQFYRFAIVRKSEDEDYSGMESIEVKTGAGSLAKYWDMVLSVANGCLVVGAAKRLPG